LSQKNIEGQPQEEEAIKTFESVNSSPSPMDARLGVPDELTFPNTAGNKLKGTSGNLMTRSSDTNNTTDTPSTMGTFQGSSHDFRVS